VLLVTLTRTLLLPLLSLLALASVASGCAASPRGFGEEIETQPVAPTALDGHLAGAPFAAMGAFSAPRNPALPGMRTFYVTSSPVDCGARAAFLADRGRPAVLEIGVPEGAVEGATFPIPKSDFAHAAVQTRETETHDGSDMKAMGRIEIVQTTKTALVLRIRAVTEDTEVEGEVTLPICPE
jgi:hypothetical protein